MNTGIVASRYAKALLKYTQETGRGDKVCAQVQALLRDPSVAAQPLEPELQKFISLLISNGRLEFVRLAFKDFVRMYYDSEGILLARLTTVKPAPETEKSLLALLEERTGRKVLLETAVDAGLVGGFVLEVDDHILDASVRSQLEAIRRQFIISNNRIV